MTSPLPAQLLHSLCALLPSHEAALIMRMPTTDLMTYVEAYAAVRRAGIDIPDALREQYVANLIDSIEAELEHVASDVPA